MKAVLALLFGLISSTYSRRVGDSVQLEFESPDSEDTDASTQVGGSSQSYNGIIIQVRQGTDEAPTIALGSDADDYDDVYCLNFVGLFEASAYDTTTPRINNEYTEIDDTRVDLADANCSTEAESDTSFSISCNNVGDGDATLTLTFTFIEDEEGDYGLEYIISLEDYELTAEAEKLVMVQSLNECGDLIDIDAESEDDEEDDDESLDGSTSSTEEPEATDSADNGIVSDGNRRLLQESSSTEEPSAEETEATESVDEETDEETDEESTDEESIESGDGLSDSDSGEFDSGFARFVVNGQALDVTTNGGEETRTEIGSVLVNQDDDDELHIVFDRFEGKLVLDPFYGLDGSKYETVYGATKTPSTTEDNATSFGIFIASIIGLIAYLW